MKQLLKQRQEMIMANQYKIGQGVKISGTFSKAGILQDPDTITLRVRTPDGTISVYTYAQGQVSKTSTGIYYKDISFALAGFVDYRWEGTGNVPAAVDNYLEVLPSVFYGGG
jgi:hypothetical protein